MIAEILLCEQWASQFSKRAAAEKPISAKGEGTSRSLGAEMLSSVRRNCLEI